MEHYTDKELEAIFDEFKKFHDFLKKIVSPDSMKLRQDRKNTKFGYILNDIDNKSYEVTHMITHALYLDK